MSDIKTLKGLLIAELVSQIENGTTVADRDGETRVISAPAPVLAVAAKVIKDWAEDLKEGAGEADMQKLKQFLDGRRKHTAAEQKPN